MGHKCGTEQNLTVLLAYVRAASLCLLIRRQRQERGRAQEHTLVTLCTMFTRCLRQSSQPTLSFWLHQQQTNRFCSQAVGSNRWRPKPRRTRVCGLQRIRQSAGPNCFTWHTAHSGSFGLFVSLCLSGYMRYIMQQSASPGTMMVVKCWAAMICA